MPLANFVWNSPPDAIVERSAFWGVLIIWWEMCAVSVGQNSVFQEIPYGGVRLVVNTNPDFYNARSSAWRHDEIITDYYALIPGDPTPFTDFTAHRQLVFYPGLNIYVININNQPSGNVGMWYELPPATENAGSLLFPPIVPAQFYTTPTLPGQLLAMPFC